MSDQLADGLSLLGIELPEETIARELDFLDELLRWNQRVNLTSIRNRKEGIEKHLIDSLLLLPHLKGDGTLLDMGSGGGLPGLPLAIACSGLDVVSIDSIGKKVNFQKHAKRKYLLNNLLVLQSRVEDLAKTSIAQKRFDIVVSRAFSSLEDFLRYAAPWVRPGGRLIAMKGPEGATELADAKELMRTLAFGEAEICSYPLPFSRAERQLIIIERSVEGTIVDNSG